MIVYLIKTLLCSGFLIGVYYLMFANETNHQLKRAYLILSLAFSISVPFLSFEAETITIPTETAAYFQVQQPSITEVRDSLENGNSVTLTNIAYLIYTSISFVFFLRFIKNSYFISLLISKNEKIKAADYTIVLVANHKTPYSFLKYIFLNKEDYLTNRLEKEVLKHEEAHVLQKHTFDILFLELLKIVFWFNPFLNVYKKAVQINHEYLADESVIRTYQDVGYYQQILFQKITINNVKFTSSFNYLSTKKRLIMMTKKTSKKVAFCKQLAIIPLVALAVFLFSEKTIAQTTHSKSAEKNVVIHPSSMPQSTKEGITKEEMAKYREIESKYKMLSKNGKNSVYNTSNISAEEQATLKKLFLGMSSSQQAQVNIAFVKRPKPMAVSVPSSTQFKALKDKAEYGIWIDEKKVANTELDKYTATDFKHVFISKLYGKAKEGRIYKYQADLMTKKFYDNYYSDWKNNQDQHYMIVKMKM